MSTLEWTHDRTTCPTSKGCLGTTECSGFPTTKDRMNMALEAFRSYADSDGTPFQDFVVDVLLLAKRRYGLFASDILAGTLGYERETLKRFFERCPARARKNAHKG